MDKKTDAEWIEEAYGDCLKQHFQTLFYNLIAKEPGALDKFEAGLRILREAYHGAVDLVKE